MFALLLVASASVDPDKYRKCEQSPFCTRNRKLENQKWEIDASKSIIQNNVFSSIIVDNTYSTNLNLLVSILQCGAVRVRVEPLEKEAFRYDMANEPTLIDQETIKALQTITLKKEGQKHIITNQDSSIKLEIQLNPFVIQMYDKDGERMVFNAKDNAVFETKRDKEKYPDMFAPYSFRGHEDHFKNGPESIGFDITYKGKGVKLSGLPSHTLDINLPTTVEGEPIRFFNTDINSYICNSAMAMYGAIPFVFAHAYDSFSGVYWANPSETWVDISKDGEDAMTTRFLSEAGYLDFYAFSSKIPSDLTNIFTKISGRPQLLPEFALGYHQSRWGYMSQDEITTIDQKFDEKIIPHDVFWLDLDHTEDRQYFIWNKQNFNKPLELLDNLASNKRDLVILVDPHLKATSSYFAYKEASDKGLLVKNKDGGEYNDNCWPGRSAWPDYFMPEARTWWEGLHDFNKFKESRPNLYIWNDMNEISVFDQCDQTAPRDNIHYGDIEEREVHNIYGHMMLSATFGGLVKRDSHQNKRPFILTRSFFAGSSKYAAAWSGDNAATWEMLSNSISVAISYNLAGMTATGSDVGGFFDSPGEDLLSRWYDVGAWCYPFFRVHCHHLANPRELYVLTGEYFDVARDAVYDRYKLLPYWYMLSRKANLTGEPIIRPLWWEFNIEEYNNVDDKILIGSGLLVVPFVKMGSDDINLVFPPGRWYDYRSLVEIKEKKHNVKFNGGRSGVFMRGGSIVPLKQRIRKSVPLMKYDPYTLYIALDEEGKASGELYDDDGDSFDFTRNSFIHKRFTFQKKELKSEDVFPESTKTSFHNQYDTRVEQLRITGFPSKPEKITGPENVEYEFDFDNGILTIHRVNLRLNANWILKID